MAYKGEDTLKKWLHNLFDMEQPLTPCDADNTDGGVPIAVEPLDEVVDGKRLQNEYTVHVTSEDLNSAAGNPGGHIWPAVLRKIIEEIGETPEGHEGLLRNTKGERFDCKKNGINDNQKWKQQYLCVVSDLVI
jgi:hypothetical protein